MKPILTVILILFSPLVLLSQEEKKSIVSGIVVDSANGQALSTASVSLLRTSKSLRKTKLTDNAGRFSFDSVAKGDYVLVISYSGYAPKTVVLSVDGDMHLENISMYTKTIDLDSVVVTSQNLQIVRSLDKLIVTVENTSLSASGTAFDILQKLPGVLLQQDGILLLNGKLVSVWMDGRPINLYGNELRNYIAALPSNTIAKVELISNPSAAYDAQSSAIINIVTTKIKKYGWNASVNFTMGYGFYARYYPSGSFNWRKNKLNFYGLYNFQRGKEKTRSHSDRYTTLMGNPNLIHTEESELLLNHNNGLKLGLDYDLNKRNFIGVMGYFNANKINSTINNNRQLQSQANVTDSTISLLNKGTNNLLNSSFNAYYRTTFDSTGKEMTINLDYWHFGNDQGQDFLNSFFNASGNKYRTDSIFRSNLDGSNNIYSVKIDFINAIKNGRFIFGAKTFFAKRDNDLLWERSAAGDWETDLARTNHFLYDENVNAVYLGIENKWRAIRYQLIARAEQTNTKGNSITIDERFTRHYMNFFPSANLQYGLGKHQFNLSYRRSINRPQFNYLDPFQQFENQYSYFVGNSVLKPEILESVELSHSFNRSLFSNLSYTHAKDVFSRIYFTDPSSQALISTYDNLSSSDRFGLNVSYNKMLTKKWMTSTSLNSSYSYVNTFFRGKPIVNKGFGLNLFTFNNFTLPKNYAVNFFIAYSSVYRSTIFKYKSSGFFNIGFQKQIPQKRLSLNLLIADIFKTSRIGYSTNYDNVAFDYARLPDSRFVNFSIAYRFGNQSIKQNENRNSGIETEKTRMKTN